MVSQSLMACQPREANIVEVFKPPAHRPRGGVTQHRQSLASWSPSTPNMASKTPEETQIVFPKGCRDAGKGVSRPQCKAAPCCLLAMLEQVPLFPSGYTGQKEAQLEIPPGRENQTPSRSTVPATTLAPTFTCSENSGKLTNLPGPQIAHR